MLKGQVPQYHDGQCSKCGGEKDLDYENPYCRSCKRVYERDGAKRRRRERKALRDAVKQISGESVEESQGIRGEEKTPEG